MEYCRKRLQTWSEEEINPLPLVTGEDLKAVGLPPGPKFKEILMLLRAAQLDGQIVTRAEALARLREIVRQVRASS